MFSRATFFRFVVVGLVLGAAAHATAQLASRSPFMPPQTSAPSGPTPGAPLEFRAYMTTSEGILFRIHDPAKKAGTWVKLNERNPDFDVVVKQHDVDHNTVTIEHQGKTLTLAGREAKVVSSGVAAPPMPPPQVVPTNVPPAVTQAVVLNPTPADEQRRLEAVAAEVARRRALREQATQNISQGTPTPIAIPQAQPVQPQVQPQRILPAMPGTYQPQRGGPSPQQRLPGPPSRQQR